MVLNQVLGFVNVVNSHCKHESQLLIVQARPAALAARVFAFTCLT